MNTKKAVLAAIYCQTAFNLLSGGFIMTTDEKKLDSQQVAPPLPDNIGITQSSGLDHHAVFNRQRVDQFVEQDVASTESARQHKDATDLICQPDTEQRQLIRRLTPLECERLQGFPDGWTDIPGASDSARYKALGNSVAIPCVTFVLRGIAAVLRETVSG
jgi:DNA (cytosine-5)-methyltransferase 1